LELNAIPSTGYASLWRHNGGSIHFGSNGRLYAEMGENAVRSNSQPIDNRLGQDPPHQRRRHDPDGQSVPIHCDGRQSLDLGDGVEEPYTFAFQPVSGRMFSNDVGETTSEEINEGVAGASYAWPLTEGPTSDAGFVTIPRPLLVIGSHQDPYGGRRPYNFVWTSCDQRRR